jgi:hypothetical protein
MKNKFLYWAPRIVSLLFVAFLMLFSLDVFDGTSGFWNIVLGLLMHNIPAFILLAIVIIAWRHELVGAIAFFLAGLVYIVLTALSALKGDINFSMAFGWNFTIAGPAFVVAILWYLGWKRKRA